MSFRPEYQVKQFVAVVQGRFGRFMVFETGAPGFYLFAQLYPGTLTQTGLQWPVRKADLRDDVRHGLANGVGYQTAPCAHPEWGYDDRGNHWCTGCRLWHDFPHEPGQDPADCGEQDPPTVDDVLARIDGGLGEQTGQAGPDDPATHPR